MTTAESLVELFDPTAEITTATLPISKRVASLDGKVIGLLDNGKSNFGNLLDDFTAVLQEKHPTATVLRRRKPSAGMPCPADTMKELLEKCDVVVTGLGD